jgi:hypothetical protein
MSKQIWSKSEVNAGKFENSTAMKEMMEKREMARIFDKGSKRGDFFKRIKGAEVTEKKMQEVLGTMVSEKNRRFTRNEIGGIAKELGIRESKYIHYDPKRNLPKSVVKEIPSSSQGRTAGAPPATGSPAPTRYMGTLSH